MGRLINVMLVDDDAEFSKEIAGFLTQHGFQVQLREKAYGTSQAVLAQQPDIVLMDISLPGISGDHLAELLSRNKGTHHIPVLLLASAFDNTASDKARESGAWGYVRKVRAKVELLAAIKGAVEAPRNLSIKPPSSRQAPESGVRELARAGDNSTTVFKGIRSGRVRASEGSPSYSSSILSKKEPPRSQLEEKEPPRHEVSSKMKRGA